jgi:hypothetical protein
VAIKLFELGFVLKAVDYLSGTLKKIETQLEAVNATAAAPWREFAGNLAMASGAIAAAGGGIAFLLKDAIGKAGELEVHMARLATAIGNVPDKARRLGEAEKFAGEKSIASGYDVSQLTESLYQGLSGFLNMTQAMAVSVEAAKLARRTTGDLTDTTSLAVLPARGLSGETVGQGFLEIMTQMSRASKRLGFEVFAGPNAQAIHLLKTLQGIQRRLGDISKHKDIAAPFEKAFGARASAAFIGAMLAQVIGAIRLGGATLAAIAMAAIAAASATIASWRPVKSFFATLTPQAFEWGVNLLKTFVEGIASGVMWPVHDTSGSKRSEQASLRAAHIAMEKVVTWMRSYLPFSPAGVGPLRDLHRVRIVETIAQTIQQAPMLAAIRRVATVAAVTMPMMIGGAAMPAAGAISSPAAAVVLNHSPHVEVHAPAGDAATLEKAVMEALEKNRREVYRMLEQVAGRRDRTRFGG